MSGAAPDCRGPVAEHCLVWASTPTHKDALLTGPFYQSSRLNHVLVCPRGHENTRSAHRARGFKRQLDERGSKGFRFGDDVSTTPTPGLVAHRGAV